MTRVADVLIQAGHEGRTSGATGAVGNGLREIDLTPRVADAAVGVLRSVGLSVLRDTATTSNATVKVAVAFHFDGPANAGAQFLYDDLTDKALADALRAAYDVHYDGKWLRDNTSYLADKTGYSRYYGFTQWTTTDGEVVLELDTLGDPVRATLWAQPGYPEWAGRVIGAAIARRLGKPVVDPGPYGGGPVQGGTPIPVTKTPILGAPVATKEQAKTWAIAGATRHEAYYLPTIGDIVEEYYRIGIAEGVRPDVALAQSAKETGYWYYGGDVRPLQWNFAGIGATGGGTPGESWPSLTDGVYGHIRRLRIYATPRNKVKEYHIYDLNILHRSLPESYWGSAPSVEDLGGKWAPSLSYGASIVKDYLMPMTGTTPSYDAPPSATYSDVVGHWAEAAIRKAIAAGVMIGDGVNWNPDVPLTRAELATVLVRTGLIT